MKNDGVRCGGLGSSEGLTTAAESNGVEVTRPRRASADVGVERNGKQVLDSCLDTEDGIEVAATAGCDSDHRDDDGVVVIAETECDIEI